MISRLVDSALRPYSPGGKLNGFPATLRSRTAIGSSSLHRLRLGLPGCLVERWAILAIYSISNPVRSPSFHPSPSSAFWQTAFAIHLACMNLSTQTIWWSSADQRILPLPAEYRPPLSPPSPAVSPAAQPLSG